MMLYTLSSFCTLGRYSVFFHQLLVLLLHQLFLLEYLLIFAVTLHLSFHAWFPFASLSLPQYLAALKVEPGRHSTTELTLQPFFYILLETAPLFVS